MNPAHWFTNPFVLAAFVLGGALQLLIARRLPQGPRMLRVHAWAAAIGIALTALAHWLRPVALATQVDLLLELVIMGWGVLFIRIVLVTLFRIVLPAVGLAVPRILHEIVFAVVCAVWALARVHSAGLDMGGVVMTSAAITAIIAFSMQETLGNILGGLALQLDKSIQIGNWVVIDGVRGKVVEVHWRHTAVLTPAGEIVVLPNSLLMKSRVTVVSTDEYPIARRNITFSTPDTIAPQLVVAGIEKALREATLAHVSATPPPDCVVSDFVEGTMQFTVRYWLLEQQHDAPADSNVRQHIHTALRRLDVALARPYLDVRVDGGTDGGEATERALRQRMEVLSAQPLFSGLHESELASVATSVRLTPFMKDDVMTRQGAVAHWLYVLVSGEADVWFEETSGERRFVASLVPGAVFGEMGMMTGAPRSATVIAKTDAECYRIDKASFSSILAARPGLADDLARIIGERQRQLDSARATQSSRVHDDGDHDKLLAKIRRFFHLPVST
jgi:small-conductance mechanosensitive channel/CRP-like cAMP-binding protein